MQNQILSKVVTLTLLTACGSETQDLGETPVVYPIVPHAIADVKAKEITLGDNHGCLLTTEGAVKCWGDNSQGQLGTGNSDDDGVPASPAPGTVYDVVGLASGFQSLAAGANHTCVVSSGGAVKCWGLSVSGQLGDRPEDEKDSSFLPLDAKGLQSATATVYANGNDSCAVTSNAKVMCWGSLSIPYSDTVEVPTPSNVASLAFLGRDGLALLRANGTVSLFNQRSASENVSLEERTTDIPSLGSGVRSITERCALTSQGGVKCWTTPRTDGIPDVSRLQDIADAIAAATDVPSLATGVSQLKCASDHCCVITEAGGVNCWGTISWGSPPGEAFTTDESTETPYEVHGLGSGIVALAVREGITCAVRSNGGVACISDCKRDSCALADNEIRLVVPNAGPKCEKCSI